MRALRIDEQTCLAFARWYQGWAIIDQVVANIRSCQISDRAKYQISRMIIPFKSLKAFSIPFSLNYCCIWGYIERSLESVNFSFMNPKAYLLWVMNINNGPNGLSLLLRDENLWEMQGKEPGSLHWLTVMGGLERNGQILTVGSNFWPETKHRRNFSSKFGSISRF